MRTHTIIAESQAMRDVLNIVGKIAGTESTVVIHGESGTGKELVAREIHHLSARSRGSFVSLNCGAIPRDLIESTLFGHVRGAFTGADRDRDGLFRVAAGGTFFLDEVGDLTLHAQVKLLRALQEREIVPVGGTKPFRIDCRLIAATNVDLERAMAEGRFRSDLYYRLNVIAIRVPPLRDRRADALPMALYFLSKCVPQDKAPPKIGGTAMRLIESYSWPGNVRELENAMERAVALCDGAVVRPEDLPDRVRMGAAGAGDVGDDRIQSVVRRHIGHVIGTSRNRSEAAMRLGINPSTLWRMLKRGSIPDSLRHEEGA